MFHLITEIFVGALLLCGYIKVRATLTQQNFELCEVVLIDQEGSVYTAE